MDDQPFYSRLYDKVRCGMWMHSTLCKDDLYSNGHIYDVPHAYLKE